MKKLTPKQLETLAKNQWAKGESGNPDGKKKGTRNYATIYRESLELLAEAGDLPADMVEVLMTVQQMQRALRGDTKAYDTLHDRKFGKAVQTNINKDISDTELDESQMADLDSMLAKFVKKKPAPKKKTKAKASKK